MTTVDEVLELYGRWGAERYDEQVAQLDHALQTAALAARAGADDALVAAALLHDVGHLLDLRGDGPGPHERTGPEWLSGSFPAEVIAPIAGHVEAKRWLCAAEPDYAAGLSEGSTRSLRRQGGPMSPSEAAAFMRVPGSAAAVRLRRWDDAAKVDGLVVAPLADYEPLLRRLSCSG